MHFVHTARQTKGEMVNFYLDTHPDKAGDCAIRVSARAEGKRLLTSIGYSINPAKWTGCQVEAGTKKNPVFNAKGIPAATINARIAAVAAAFAKIEATPGAATLAAYQAELDRITGRTARKAKAGADLPEVLAAFDKFVVEESQARQWTEGTLEMWHAFRQHLQNFKSDLVFSDLNEKGLAKFMDFLRTRAASELKKTKDRQAGKEERPHSREGLAENTAQKHFNNLKWFLKWCIRSGYCNQREIEAYRPKFKLVAKPVIFLTRQELLQLYNYEIPANGTKVKLKDYSGLEYEKVVQEAGALAKTRDLFCFCAFTSLRYSDMAKLKRSSVTKNAIIVTTQKTNDRLEIPLNNYSRAILDKYADLCPEGLALPVIANQNMNYYLKDLCELCGFNDPIARTYYKGGQRCEEIAPKWQLMSTHAGRRTFICYALTKGIPPQVVMKFTGHSDYKAMKPYIDIAAADAAAAMQLMND